MVSKGGDIMRVNNKADASQFIAGWRGWGFCKFFELIEIL